VSAAAWGGASDGDEYKNRTAFLSIEYGGEMRSVAVSCRAQKGSRPHARRALEKPLYSRLQRLPGNPGRPPEERRAKKVDKLRAL
jgi:hypothetical protein